MYVIWCDMHLRIFGGQRRDGKGGKKIRKMTWLRFFFFFSWRVCVREGEVEPVDLWMCGGGKGGKGGGGGGGEESGWNGMVHLG